MFRHRQQLRRWAAGVLLLWWFGIGAAVANACLAPVLGEGAHQTGADAGHSGLAQHHERSPAGAHHQSAHQHEPDGADASPSSSARANCQDFCDKASVSLAPLKSPFDDAQGLAPPSRPAGAVLSLPALRSVQGWVPRRDGVLTPSILVAFLRLAL